MSNFNPIPMYISTPPAKYKPSAARLAKIEPNIAAQLAVLPTRGECGGIKNDGDLCGRRAVPGMLTCSRHLAQEATVRAAEEVAEEESAEEEAAEESDDAWQEEVPEVAAEEEEVDEDEYDEEYSPMYLSDGGEYQAEIEEVEDEDFYSVLCKPSTKFTGQTATTKSNKNSKGETAMEASGAGLRTVSLNTNNKKSKGKGKTVQPGSGFGYRKVEYPMLPGVDRPPTKAAQPQDNLSRNALLATHSQKQTRGVLKPGSGFTIRDDSSRIPVRGESLGARARRGAPRLNQDRPLDLEEEEQSVGTAYGA